MTNPKATSGKQLPAYEQIPLVSLKRLAAIFSEGERKHGRDNWKNGTFDPDYRNNRLNHAIEHLMKLASGDESEDHAAKVAWFCATEMWHQEQIWKRMDNPPSWRLDLENISNQSDVTEEIHAGGGSLHPRVAEQRRAAYGDENCEAALKRRREIYRELEDDDRR